MIVQLSLYILTLVLFIHPPLTLSICRTAYILVTIHKTGALKMNEEKGYKQHQHELQWAYTTAGAVLSIQKYQFVSKKQQSCHGIDISKGTFFYTTKIRKDALFGFPL